MAIPTLSRTTLPQSQVPRLTPGAEPRVDTIRRAGSQYAQRPPASPETQATRLPANTPAQEAQPEAQRLQQTIAQREQQQQRATERADDIEQRRARRIRETVEAREIRQQQVTQETVQAREAQQRKTEARIVSDVRTRARQLQQEAQEAQRREAAANQARISADAQARELSQSPSKDPEPSAPQQIAGQQIAAQPAEVIAAPQTTAAPQQATDTLLQDDADVAELIQQETDIMERLISQQLRDAEVSGQQLDTEASLARSTLEARERNARHQRPSPSSASRLANFIDLIS